HPVSQTPTLYVTQTDDPGRLRQHPATVGSRADGSACAWHEIDRRDVRGAKPAPVHLRAVEVSGHAVRHAWIQLVQKGRRYRQDGSEAIAEVSVARHHRSLRSG